MQDLKELFEKYELRLTDSQEAMLLKYYEELVEWNKKFNLTAITEQDEVFVKHFLDSAVGIKYVPSGASIVDIGAGAGFPSLVMKIMRPDLDVTMVDSLNKRVTFLNHMIETLSLKGIKAEHMRAEEIKEKFDFCVARAVANLSTLLEYSIPVLKVGGKLVALKGLAVDEELEGAQNAMSVLGAKLVKKDVFELEGNSRAILVFEKIKETDKKYPRQKNLPRTKPL